MDNIKKYITKSFEETKALGQNFAREILASNPKNSATILALSGELGAGKTTFLQGFAKGLGIEEKILSPTFIIMKKFQIQNYKPQINSKFKIQNSKFSYFYHFDCYRLNEPEEILELGFREIISNPENIVAIEWPEKISGVLPEGIIDIEFNHLKENKRRIIIDRQKKV